MCLMGYCLVATWSFYCEDDPCSNINGHASPLHGIFQMWLLWPHFFYWGLCLLGPCANCNEESMFYQHLDPYLNAREGG
jgi:hypothetical protein